MYEVISINQIIVKYGRLNNKVVISIILRKQEMERDTQEYHQERIREKRIQCCTWN